MVDETDRDETPEPQDIEIEAELVPADEIPNEPDEASVEDEPAEQPSPPVAADVVYAEVPNPFGEATLLAHDPEALAMALADRDSQIRAVYTEEPDSWAEFQIGLQRIHEVEDFAVRRAKNARRARGTRRMFRWIVALGLPFTVASLLGALGLLIEKIPTIGSAVGEFVGTSGSSLGGLPLGILIAGVPSIWIFWKTSDRPALSVPPRPSKSGRRITPRVTPTGGPDYADFLSELEPLIEESRQLSGGRRYASGEIARRQETLFRSMYRVARRHGIHPAATMFESFKTRMWRASAHAQRRIGFIALRRAPIRFDALVAPYSTRESSNRLGTAAAYLRIPAAVGIAALLFLLGGLYRLAPNEAEVLRTNQVHEFQRNLDVFSLLNFTWDHPTPVKLDSINTIDGPGWYWSWPLPLTQREHLVLSGRTVELHSFLGLTGTGSMETVSVNVVFSIQDTGKWVFWGRARDAEQQAADRLSQVLADYLAVERDERASAPGRTLNLTEALKDDMQLLLTNFISDVNTQGEVIDLGIHVDSAGSYSFAVFPS